jgi:coenzyme F420-0:L-glutamate ligase/coenzyme F420-1:gamma-L-glutamate ligase
VSTPDGPRPHIVVHAVGATADALIDAATLAERIRTALGAESLGVPLPEITLEIVHTLSEEEQP